MKVLTKGKAARLFAARQGISVDRAEQMIDRRASAYETWAAQQGITIQTVKETRARIATENAQDISGALCTAWQSIVDCQNAIQDALHGGGKLGDLRLLSGALKDLQGGYMQLAEIKRAADEQTGNSLSRQAVESILDDGLPQLKAALQDLFLKVKLNLKPENRAEFDIAWNNALPAYNRRLSGIIDDLNAILDTGAGTDKQEEKEDNKQE